MKPEIVEFLQQSNYIENERSDIALDDAIKAWKFAFQYRNNITLGYIRTIHQCLMRRVRHDIAGSFRTCDVWIGGERKKYRGRAILFKKLHKLLLIIIADISNTEDSNDTDRREKLAKHAHIVFEQIHPFEDGNGRIGRILYNIHRLKLGLPIHTIYEKEKQQYYKWFH